MAQANVILKKPLEHCVLNVSLHITQEFKLRMWLGKHLLFWAARVLGANAVIDTPKLSKKQTQLRIDGILTTADAVDSRFMKDCRECDVNQERSDRAVELLRRINDAMAAAALSRISETVQPERAELCPHGTTYKECKQGCPPWRVVPEEPASSGLSYQHVMDPLEAAHRPASGGYASPGTSYLVGEQPLEPIIPKVPEGYSRHTVSFCILCGGIYHTQKESDDLNNQVLTNIAEEWNRRYKAKLLELGHNKSTIEEYMRTCATPDFKVIPERAACNISDAWKRENAEYMVCTCPNGYPANLGHIASCPKHTG